MLLTRHPAAILTVYLFDTVLPSQSGSLTSLNTFLLLLLLLLHKDEKDPMCAGCEVMCINN